MEKYRYIFYQNLGFAGCDGYDFIEYDYKPSDDELNETAWELAKDHAESYGYYPRYEYENEEDFDEEDEHYIDGIEGWWEVYNHKEHSGLCVSGDPFGLDKIQT
jgi:hypothetical protein